MTRIKGNKALAAELGVGVRTVQRWRREGILTPAILADFRRTIIYDLDKVLLALRNRTPRPMSSR